MSDEMQVVSEVELSMEEKLAAVIAGQVQTIRALKMRVDELEQSSGIAAAQVEIETRRAAMVDFCREFKEMTGQNWMDEEGYARYVQPGERQSYDRDAVDQALAALLALQAEMSVLADDREGIVMISEYGMVKVKEFLEVGGVSTIDLRDAIRQLDEHRLEIVREVNLRLNAMDRHLKNMAAGRKTSQLAEGVQIK